MDIKRRGFFFGTTLAAIMSLAAADVRDFGAVGDGVTDDTKAIQRDFFQVGADENGQWLIRNADMERDCLVGK